MKITKAMFGWTELVRTVVGLLTCLGLAVSSACSSVQSTSLTADQPSAGSSTRAGQLQNLIHPGTDVQITEKNGRVSMVHVNRIDNEVITGKTSEGRVTISLVDIAEARVRKGPPKSMRGTSDSRGTVANIDAGKVLTVVAVAGMVVLAGYWIADGWSNSLDLSGLVR